MSDPPHESIPDPKRRSLPPLNDQAPDPSDPALQRALGSPAAWLRFIIPAALGMAADLWLKSWSFPNGVPAAGGAGGLGGMGGEIAGRHPLSAQPVIDHVLAFQTTVNHGAVFGIAQGMVGYFLLFSIFAMAMILWVFVTSRRSHWLVHIALGLITAGALGNLYDRAVFGGVRDMLKIVCIVWHGKDYYPFIFNIADVLLCIGVPLLMVRWLFIKDPQPAK